MKTPEKVANLARASGFESAEYIGKWEGFDVFKPVSSGREYRCIGLPMTILSNGETVRWSSPDETFKIFDRFF